MNFPFQMILCPVEFEGEHGLALEAARQVLASGGTVYLLHVVPMASELGQPHVVKSDPDEKVEEAKALSQLKELAARHLSGIKCELLTRDADAPETAQAILDVADEIKPDAIIVYTHARRGILRMVLGSVAADVARSAKCPVIVLNPTVH